MTSSSNAAKTRSGVRFAPSPTGRFHIGNLRTAWISHAWARALKTPWVVRFEDIDGPRVVPGARAAQLEDMAALGLTPDELVTQSAFHAEHHRLFERAVTEGRVYPCDCSRKDVQSALSGFASAPHQAPPVYSGPVYSGHCRKRDTESEPLSKVAESWAWRFKMEDASGVQDFIVARSRPAAAKAPEATSFSPGYHWACAIDDHFGRYRLLVRAWDLESSAPLQRAIQTWLCALENSPEEVPALFHTALVTDDQDGRLEKRSRGVTLPELLAAGRRPEDIVASFERSFDSALLLTSPSPGTSLGEKSRQLRLAELNLTAPPKSHD